MLEYAEQLPPPALRRYIKCIWRVRGPAVEAAQPEPVIPDGCVEVVLNFGDAFRRHQAVGSEKQPMRLLAGQLTQAVSIAPTGAVDLWGVRFHPWGAAPFLGVSGIELRDRMLPLDVLGGVDRLVSRTLDGSSEDARGQLLFGALHERLVKARHVEPTLPILATLAARGAVVSVKGLAQVAGLSVRRVQLLFSHDVGLPPKALMRLTRFQRAVALARGGARGARMNLGRVAAECGYFDHAHLIRDARAIVGLTPSALVPEMGAITNLFITA